MKWLILIAVMSLVFSSVYAVTESDVPNLKIFQQFYGQITQLPAGAFQLRIQAGSGVALVTPVAADGKYGYSEVVKVSGTSGAVVSFTVVNLATGVPIQIGTEPYVSGGVTQKNLEYRGADAVNTTISSSQGGGAIESPRAEPTAEGTGRGRRRATSDAAATTVTPRSACLYSWDCGMWSACIGGSQTRSCIRSDTCDAELARSEVLSITPIPKPIEQQSCSSGSGNIVCPRNNRRCIGNNLQECSADGTSWTTIDSCVIGCSPVTSSCKSAPDKVVKPESAIPWIPIAGGTAGLILIAAVIFLVLHFKHSKNKLQPVREYIFEAKRKGFSDEVIKTKLVAQGWDADVVERVLKK